MFKFLKKFFGETRNKMLGNAAEKFAVKYIKKNTPYKILACNYRYKEFEADIIAYDKSDNALLVIEVKARNKDALVSGYISATTKSKLHSVSECMNRYARTCRHKFDYQRYNVFEVSHDSQGKIVDYYLHENIPLRNSLKEGRQI